MPYRLSKSVVREPSNRSTKKRINNFSKKSKKYDFRNFRSKMGVSGGKVRLVGQFEILAQDNFFEQSPSSRPIFGNPILLDKLKRRNFSRN